MLLRNDGRGRFTDVTAAVAPGARARRHGHRRRRGATWTATAAPTSSWSGEWMPITVFRNAGGGRLERARRSPGLEQSDGWWNRIVAGDFTGDGRVDFVVGNLGLNTRLRATPTRAGDDVREGLRRERIRSSRSSRRTPTARAIRCVAARRSARGAAVAQGALPDLQGRTRARRSSEIFTPRRAGGRAVRSARTRSRRRSCATTATARSRSSRCRTRRSSRRCTASSPTTSDGDGHTDLLLAGNFDGFKPEIGRMASSYGVAAPRRRQGRVHAGARRRERLPRARAGARHRSAFARAAGDRYRRGPQQRRPAAVPSLGAASPSRRARAALSGRLSDARLGLDDDDAVGAPRRRTS